jgi:hypothetical protein
MLIASTAIGADDRSIFGTHWVQFEPVQVAGTLIGCSLTFVTVTADRAYLGGSPVALNGSISLRNLQQGPQGLGLTLKLGLNEIQSGKGFVRPAFAYLQTESGTTAKASQASTDGDPGYKLFTYRAAESSVMSVLKDLIGSSKVTIGYNRNKDGIDVLVPLDLTVVDSQYSGAQEVLRKRSPEVASQWGKCISSVIQTSLESK